MGNRAVLQLGTNSTVGIYLHWNGGRDSVEGFLEATRQFMGNRVGDETYSSARLVQLICNFFEGNLSVGLGNVSELDCDNMDNGKYVIDMKTLKIVAREYHSGAEQNGYDTHDFAKEVIGRTQNKKEASIVRNAFIFWARLSVLFTN